MKNMRRLLILSGAILIVALTIFIVNQEIINAQDCRIVRIHGKFYQGRHFPGGTIRIEPPTLFISKGTCVIWINWADDDVTVMFEEGKPCQDATEAPTDFKLDASNCYVTSWISRGQTSSLSFTHEGTFNYEVTWAGKKRTERGTILVR